MNTIIKRYITLIVIGLMACSVGYSQSKHEISAWGIGGFSSLNYDSSLGERDNRTGMGVGIGYSYAITKNISINTGLEYASYKANYFQHELKDATYMTNDGTDDFEFRYTVRNYKERQIHKTLNIPIMVQYQTEGDYAFFGSLGGKIGIPIKSEYSVTRLFMKTTGYYEQYGGLILDEPEFMGFGLYGYPEGREGNKDLDMKLAFMLSAEAGLKCKLYKSMSLYTGLYVDYGINDVRDNKNKEFQEYNTTNPENIIHNSVLASGYTSDGEWKNMTDKVIPISFGIKVRLAFNLPFK